MSKIQVSLVGAALILVGTGLSAMAATSRTCLGVATSGCAIGVASWYGEEFDGQQTASGEVFDADSLTAAHPSLPFQTRLKVTNLANGRSVVVRVNDRGPANGRLIDLSEAAAERLGMKSRGFARVELRLQ